MKMKKLFCLLLTLCMVLTMVPVCVAAEEDVIASGSVGGDNTIWKITADGTLTLTGPRYMEGVTNHDYPWLMYADQVTKIVIEGLTTIAEEAFNGMSNVTEVSLPNTIETIGDAAFLGCSRLTEVHIPGSVKEIGAYAFSGLENLTALTFDAEANLEILGEYCFRGTSIVTLDLPAPLRQIDRYAFYECDDLTTVKLPETLESISNFVFAECTSLRSINLPASLTDLRPYAFDNCHAFESLEIYTNQSIDFGDQPLLTTVVVGGNATKVGNFENCTALTDVTIGNSVLTIDNYAFNGCSALTELALPNQIQTIGNYAFGSTALTSIRLPATVTEIGMYAFVNCTAMKSLYAPCKDATYSNGLGDFAPEMVIYAWEGSAIGDYAIENGITFVPLHDASHTYDDGVVTTAPTCMTPGERTFSCLDCDEKVVLEIANGGHIHDEGVTTEPTCTEDGSVTYTCTVCGETVTETIPATGHSYDAGTTTADPTCTTDGVMTYACAICGETETEAIPALGHSYDEGTVIQEATCTAKGITIYTCTVCGVTKEEADIPTVPHSYDEGTVTKEPTCITMGTRTYTCTVCGATIAEDIIYNPHEYLDGTCITCGCTFNAPKIYSCYSKTQTSVKVSWFEAESAEGYQLFRATSPDAPDEEWTCVKTITSGTTDRYTNQGLEIGTTYYYKVRAFLTDINGNRMYSDFSPVAYMPAAVVFDGPYSNATFRIRLRWNEVSGAHGYQIWRQSEDGSWAIVKTLGDKGNELTNNQGATTAYSNTGLTAGETYTYKMRAFMITEDGRKVFGAYSDEYTVTVMPEAPAVTGTSPKATRAQLSWEALNGAAGYQVWMAESEDGEYKIVKSITDGSTTYTKYDLTSGKTYCFKVRAYTEVEGKKTFGAYSEIVAVTVQ